MSHAAALTNHDPTVYKKNASFVYSAAYTAAVLGLLDAKKGERIADLGCGTGEVTMQVLKAVGEQGEVIGFDSNQQMLDKCKLTTEGKIRLIQADVQYLPATLDPSLKGTFDAVFTTATLHWAKADPGGVIDGIKWLLKPGGRVAFEFGGFGNAVGVRAAVHQVLRKQGLDPIPLDPFYYPTDRQYAKLLTERGMIPSDNIGLFPRPTPLPGDLKGWLVTFVRNTYFSNLEAELQDRLMDEVQEICRPDGYWNDSHPGSGVPGSDVTTPTSGEIKEGWEIMYVRLRGTATKPAQ